MAGKYVGFNGSVACFDCGLGAFADRSGLTKCTACPAGTFMNDNVLTGPIPIHFASSDHSCKMLNLEGNAFEVGPGGAAAAQKQLKQLLPGAFVGV